MAFNPLVVQCTYISLVIHEPACMYRQPNSTGRSVSCVLNMLKVHFMIHSLIRQFFSKKVQIFTSVEAFRYINVCVQNNSFVWENNYELLIYYVDYQR